MEIVENKTFDQERALYGSRGVVLRNCSFDGPADGESALKESKDVTVNCCYCNLRYPFWHVDRLTIADTEMTELCRAAIWYSRYIDISNSRMHGIKALRECSEITIKDCDIKSPEFGWSVNNITMEDSDVSGEYFMMRSSEIKFRNVTLHGKYSFQYVENCEFDCCDFDTKDAFWHGKNIIVRDSVIKGEYFAWYSDGLTLINCKISGTQPFCYCRNLKLVNCELTDADLSFEKSEVDADITTPVVSIKNPASGTIRVPSVGEVIMTDVNANGEIILK
ncbi:MAG: DUF3737 family protein [Alistipes sp.]|nr:DUF3737 family protein [Alistipes sp.]